MVSMRLHHEAGISASTTITSIAMATPQPTLFFPLSQK